MNTQPTTPLPGAALVREMDIVAPRYTSYPTIPVWEATEDDTLARKLLARERPGRPVSMYLHVPFCEHICSYCGCNTALLRNDEQLCRYTDVLVREIEVVRGLTPAPGPVVQIHWGGGTPSVLPPEQFNRILSLLWDRFDTAPESELAIETNPMTCSNDKLRFLLRAGFNRFSIGIQDFDPQVQENIDRGQTFERTVEFCEIIREGDVKSLNFDLVYGLPGQTVEGLADTLDKVAGLRPDRIAVYSFAFLPQLRANQRSIDPGLVPGGDVKFELYLLVISALQEAGYRMIGMDHFALPDDELALAHERGELRRNFMGYTTCPESDMLAFGASAIADLGDYYSQNDKSTGAYMRAVDEGELPVRRQLRLDADDQLRRAVIMGILCNGAVEKAAVERRFDIDFDQHFKPELQRLGSLVEKDMVEDTPETVRATRLGSYFLRNIAMHFDNYLDGRKGDGAKQTFSRTV